MIRPTTPTEAKKKLQKTCPNICMIEKPTRMVLASTGSGFVVGWADGASVCMAEQLASSNTTRGMMMSMFRNLLFISNSFHFLVRFFKQPIYANFISPPLPDTLSIDIYAPPYQGRCQRSLLHWAR